MARKKKIHHRHNRLSFGGKLAFVLLTILSAVILIPIVFTFLYSFFPQSEITAYLKGRGSYDTTKWLDVLYSPAMFSLRQYYKIFIEEPSYLKLFCNSMMYTGAILVGQALIVPLTAYCLSRFQFHGRDLLFFCILVLMILPFQVTMAPSVTVLRWLGIMETPWAVILPMCFSPFYIFLLRQFMVGIPNELLEAGMVDGVGPVRGFVHVILPVCKPILGAAAALRGLLEHGRTAADLFGEPHQLAAAVGYVQPDQHRPGGCRLCGQRTVHPADAADLSVFPRGHRRGHSA